MPKHFQQLVHVDVARVFSVLEDGLNRVQENNVNSAHVIQDLNSVEEFKGYSTFAGGFHVKMILIPFMKTMEVY